MSDLIRKADVLPIFCMRCVRVIDCVNDMTGNFQNNCPIKKEVDDLPSAEPERKIYTKMPDAEFEKWLHDNGICNPNIHESIPCSCVPLLIDSAINELPHTEPERHGQWIHSSEFKIVGNPYGHYTCDQCDGIVAFETNYCPNCGAKMEGENDG